MLDKLIDSLEKQRVYWQSRCEQLEREQRSNELESEREASEQLEQKQEKQS